MRSLLIAILLCLIVGKAHYLFSGDEEWYAYSIGLMAQQLIIGAALFQSIDYADLGRKWLAFIICAAPVIEMVLFFTGSLWWFGIAAILSLSWLAWVAHRRYNVESDTFNNDYVFIIAKRPNSLITFLASLIGTPFGRYSYYLDGDVYHYHRHYFKKSHITAFPSGGSTIIRTKIRVTTVVKEALDRTLGTRWSPLNNCLTVKLGENNG